MDIEAVIALRLKINDPSGFPVIQQGDVPDTPDELVCYRVDEDQYYNSDSELQKLYLSDSILDSMITTYGDSAECRCYSEITKKIGAQRQILRLTSGTETAEWESLTDTYNYYKALRDDCKAQIASDNGNDSGKMGQSKQPTLIGGWNL